MCEPLKLCEEHDVVSNCLVGLASKYRVLGQVQYLLLLC
jgi:hypothetical protein